jgi:hypothetical protein
MGRKGEEHDRRAGQGVPAAGPGDRRPGDADSWVDPIAARVSRLDPFARGHALGPKGYRRPDERIRDEVCERIARSGIDARDVEVGVAQGEVTLSGTALTREDKRALEDVADDVFGVGDVHNRLRLAKAPPARRGRGRRRGTTH